MPKYEGVSVDGEPKVQKDERQSFEMTDKQKDRIEFISRRLQLMKKEKDECIVSKNRAIMLYDGKLRMDGDPSRPFKNSEAVSPMARTFVDAQTAEEAKSYSDYQFFPVDDENDQWRAELMTEIVEHTRRVTKSRAKRIELIRMKNIIGSSVKWKGYRKNNVMINVAKKIDDLNNATDWEMEEAPGEDEIFEEVVDVLNDFLIDPEATTINDALDCALYFRMHHEEAAATFGGDAFDFDEVGAGANDMIEGVMYFKKPSARPDMFAVYCWPSNNYGVRGMVPGKVKEVYYGGLPDEHKMLPFISYHNVQSFTTGLHEDITRSSSGEAASTSGSISSKQKFWKWAGIPEIMLDLIELRTEFVRSMYKASDLASRSLVVTKGNFRIDTSRDWKHGDQIVGGMGKVDTQTFGVSNLSVFTTILDFVYNDMIQVTGVDPRNLTDTKQKTLGETIAQRETQMTRLETIIDYNQEVAEVRDGLMTKKLIEQHYTKMKVVRLTGEEDPKELDRYDEIEGEHPRTGKPTKGRMYRRIRTSRPLKIKGKGTKKMRNIRAKQSLVLDPELVRGAELDVYPVTKKRAGELQSMKAQQLKEGIEVTLSVFQLAMPSPDGTPPMIRKEDLPDIGDMLEDYYRLIGHNVRNKTKSSSQKEIEKIKSERVKMNSIRKPITDIPDISQIMQPQPDEASLR